MGWCREDAIGHEGFAAALVERVGAGAGSKLYRELHYPSDDQSRQDIAVVQAGCVCGWRSPYLPYLREPAEWHPFCTTLGEHDEDRVHRLWDQHVSTVHR